MAKAQASCTPRLPGAELPQTLAPSAAPTHTLTLAARGGAPEAELVEDPDPGCE